MKNRTVNLIITIVILGVLASAAIAPIAKAQSPKISFNPAEQSAGKTIVVTGTGFGAGEPVSMTIANVLFGYVNATDSTGGFVLTVTVDA
ncbi:MAG: hypothetical protein ABSF65_09365, partial [Candidatus Bathyarchaeia archaeon]